MLALFASARRILDRLRVLDERGVTSAEYALMATLIAVVISGAVAVFGLSVSNLFSGIVGAF
jgi:Flp pilus assembly pilin Flp